MRYYIRYEKMAGQWYYMIYQSRRFFADIFIERYNKSKTALLRLEELNRA